MDGRSDIISSIVGHDRVLFRKYEFQRDICTGRMTRRPTEWPQCVILTDLEAHASSSIGTVTVSPECQRVNMSTVHRLTSSEASYQSRSAPFERLSTIYPLLRSRGTVQQLRFQNRTMRFWRAPVLKAELLSTDKKISDYQYKN